MICLLPLLMSSAITPAPSVSLPEPSLAGLTLAPVEDAPEMEYTYIEANFLWTDSDGLGEELTGGEITGSLELPLNLFVQLTGSQLSDSTDVDQYRLGVGWHFGLIPRLDAYGIASYAETEIDGSGGSFDDEGWVFELGLRFLLTDSLEVNGSMEWVDLDESDVGGSLGVRYYIIDALSLGARVETLDSDETISVGARFEL